MEREMTSRERLWAVLNHRQPDRVPIWMLFPREQLPHYVDVHSLPSYARVLPHVWRNTDWLDRRFIEAPPFFTGAAEVEERTGTQGAWTITRRILHTPLGDLTSEVRRDDRAARGAATEFYCKDVTDLEKVLSIPYEPAEPDLTAIGRAAGRLGDAGVMMISPPMPVGVAYYALGPEQFALYTLTERETLARFIRVMFDRAYGFLKQALKAGAGPVFFLVDTEFMAPPLCSPQSFDALLMPVNSAIIELVHAHGGKVIVHHHGKIDALLERIAEMGADGIHPVEEPPVGDCTLAEAKRRVGDRVCFVGSVQYDDFERLTRDQMEDLVKRQIRDAADGGGVILAPTAGPYAVELTERQQENTIRFIEAGRRWGRYPLQVS